MPLTVKWDEGVAIQYRNTRIVFDPRRKNNLRSRIFITHAHYDHSKGFSFSDFEKVSTVETKEIVEAYGKEINNWKPLPIGGKIRNEDLEVVSHNAGHVLGSSIFEVITPESNIVYTGDLQFKDSFTLKGAEPVPCDILVIESTFGSKSFSFPEREKVAHEMVQWASNTVKTGKVPTFKTDTLGNAQEVNKAFNLYSKLPVTVHCKIAQINKIYKANGQPLEFLDATTEEASEVTSSGECVFITPKNIDLVHHPEFEPALVSGWALWTNRNKNAFALSDHADFKQLIEFVEACEPRAVLTCFGGKFNHMFAKHVEKKLKIEARPLNLIPTMFAPNAHASQNT